jgi:hypothetical protein
MSKLLKERRRELASKSAALKVTRVLVRRNRAVAYLRFLEGEERRVWLRREFGTWKKTELFDVPAVP